MKLYETLQIVERVAWCEDWETEGENKNTKWENSRNYLYINKTVISVRTKQCNVRMRKNNL